MVECRGVNSFKGWEQQEQRRQQPFPRSQAVHPWIRP